MHIIIRSEHIDVVRTTTQTNLSRITTNPTTEGQRLGRSVSPVLDDMADAMVEHIGFAVIGRGGFPSVYHPIEFEGLSTTLAF